MKKLILTSYASVSIYELSDVILNMQNGYSGNTLTLFSLDLGNLQSHIYVTARFHDECGNSVTIRSIECDTVSAGLNLFREFYIHLLNIGFAISLDSLRINLS